MAKPPAFMDSFDLNNLLVFIVYRPQSFAMITGSFGELKENKLGSDFDKIYR
jgi:hypothetical protein